MKTIARVTGVIFLTLGLISCSPAQPGGAPSSLIEATPQPAPQNTTAASTRTVALVMKTLTNPFFVEMEKGARKAEGELGIQLIVKTAAQETSIQQQIEIVNDMINAHVDAIVIAPGDSKELIPVLKKAQDAGINVVNIDNKLDTDLSSQLGLKDVPFISVDNQVGAYSSAKYIADQIHSPTKAVILEGIREAKNAQDRLAGAQQAFNENQNISVVASESAHWKIDEAHDVVAHMFEANPDIGAVFCANDMMALGVIQYLDEKHLSNVLVAGFDDLEEAQDAIRQGKLAATVDQQAALQGYTGVRVAVDMIDGKTQPVETLVDVKLVNKDNLP
jgi:ribose transport system substrate-binding protein